MQINYTSINDECEYFRKYSQNYSSKYFRKYQLKYSQKYSIFYVCRLYGILRCLNSLNKLIIIADEKQMHTTYSKVLINTH